MLVNSNTVLVGHKVVLVPYRREHVPKYHEWMKDPLIQAQTASEPLSLEEEYAMQQSWAVDEDKLTFIILAQDSSTEAHGAAALLESSRMVGDVNVFFNPCHDDDDDEERSQALNSQRQERLDAECEIMIAEQDARRRGLAKEALQMMLNYVTSTTGSKLPIPSSWLTCKIALTNDASIALFESLGFTKQKVSEIWQEVEMRFSATGHEHEPLFPGSIIRVL